MSASPGDTLSDLLGPAQSPLSKAPQSEGMTLTTLITVNAVLGTAIAYALHHLLAHGIRSDRLHQQRIRTEVAELPTRESERIAA
jgi:tetrahydromethanopterin S-methyltransferase subunit B